MSRDFGKIEKFECVNLDTVKSNHADAMPEYVRKVILEKRAEERRNNLLAVAFGLAVLVGTLLFTTFVG